MAKTIRRQQVLPGYVRVRGTSYLLPSAKKKLQEIAKKEGVSFSCLQSEAMIALYKIILEEEKATRRKKVRAKNILRFRPKKSSQSPRVFLSKRSPRHSSISGRRAQS
jgi:hypothetical protein